MVRQNQAKIGLTAALVVALFALALQTGRTAPFVSAGAFPDFISMPGVTPRGVAVDKIGNVYVSVGEVRSNTEYIQVRKFTPAGEQLFSVEIGQGTIGGLTVTANGDLYIAIAAGSARGVYRMERDGEIELLPGSSNIFFANGLAFDDSGTLYITESVSLGPGGLGPGSIWRIERGEDAELWMRDEIFMGTGALGAAVPIGANGLAYYHGNLYVANTEQGTIVRIPVEKDGMAGEPEVWPLEEIPESPLEGLFGPPMGDGISVDVHGNLYVAVLTRSAVVRINASDRSQQTVALLPSSLLDFPASLFFGTGKGERTSLFVTNLGLGKWAGPSLVKLNAGVPGDPLH